MGHKFESATQILHADFWIRDEDAAKQEEHQKCSPKDRFVYMNVFVIGVDRDAVSFFVGFKKCSDSE